MEDPQSLTYLAIPTQHIAAFCHIFRVITIEHYAGNGGGYLLALLLRGRECLLRIWTTDIVICERCSVLMIVTHCTTQTLDTNSFVCSEISVDVCWETSEERSFFLEPYLCVSDNSCIARVERVPSTADKHSYDNPRHKSDQNYLVNAASRQACVEMSNLTQVHNGSCKKTRHTGVVLCIGRWCESHKRNLLRIISEDFVRAKWKSFPLETHLCSIQKPFLFGFNIFTLHFCFL